MARRDATVDDLVGMVERGELRLPEMQRRYVWRSTRVRDLMDSLYRGYPSGAILIWEADEAVPMQEFSVSQQDSPYQKALLLLDGQQRLTSLSAVIRGEPVTVRGRKKPLELLFNLDHPEKLELVTEVNENASDDENEVGDDDAIDSSEDELMQRFQKMTFVVSTKKLLNLPNWIKVTDAFKNDDDADILDKTGITSLKDPRYRKYSQRLAKLRGIRNYVYRLDVLERDLSYEEVTEIFVRVNSLGAKLRGSDLALAQITARWKNSLAVFQNFQMQCKDQGFDLDLGIYLKNMIAFITAQSRFLSVNTIPLDDLNKGWEESKKGMEFAINFMRNNAGITSPALLASPFILITVAYYGYKHDYQISTEMEKSLTYWIRITNAKGRYSRGSSESFLDQDLGTIRDGGIVEDLLARLKNQVGTLDVTPEELVGRTRRSALFKTMFMAFKSLGAKDWNSNLSIGIVHAGAAHKLQFHHIFPKAYLRKEGYTAKEADDISNFAFIGGKTNRKISDKAPAIYFKDIKSNSGSEAFDLQCIPHFDELLDAESFKEFLNQRRMLISDCLNKYVKG